MEADYIDVGKDLIGHLRAIIPDVTFEGTTVTLIAFDVYNIGTSQKKWWYDEVEFITESGNAFDAADVTYEGWGDSHEDVPDGWEPRPKIAPETGQRALGEIQIPDDQEIEQLQYHYSGEHWAFEMDDETLTDLTLSFETFCEEEVDQYFDWGSVDIESLREQAEESDSDSSSTVSESNQPVEESGIPDVSFDDVGGLDEQIQELRETVQAPLQQPEVFDEIGIDPPEGLLLHGPPGTGKTLLAKAVANESNATFFRVSGPELAQKYVGEGARIVRETFQNAQQHEPSIIFIDEIDAIATSRTDEASGGQEGVYRTMMQLLAEMDGFEEKGEIRVIGATNRLDRIDRALLRPGRFDRVVGVPEPNEEGRTEIFRQYASDMNTENIDFSELGRRTKGMTGAQIKLICTEAGYMAFREDRTTVRQADFFSAVHKVGSNDVEEGYGRDRSPSHR
jgi:26S proteasome subunit P45 family